MLNLYSQHNSCEGLVQHMFTYLFKACEDIPGHTIFFTDSAMDMRTEKKWMEKEHIY